MAEAFIIMQIGNADLDEVCERAIVPAIEACGLDARRVDKHNEGGLLKSEIIKFIQNSEIIVADLTNERPNCYLEIGYAMGLDKLRNLILTAREDHYQGSPSHLISGPKIHFDLSGYDILFWSSENLDAFKMELEKRIRRRLLILAPAGSDASSSPWDEEWIATQRKTAIPRFQATKKTGFMEARIALAHPKIERTQSELDKAARESEIHTFGWPIGVYLGNVEEYRPRPRSDGISATVTDMRHFDYWAWRRNGDFYLLKSLFEDDRGSQADQDRQKLFFNTRIVRVTELLLYCARVYSRLDVDPSDAVHVTIRHGGLRGREIGSTNPGRILRPYRPTEEEEVETTLHLSLSQIEANLAESVKNLLAPLFVVFDFFEVANSVYEGIVSAFVEGRVT